MLKIKFDRLDYQELVVNSISNVFKNIAFKSNSGKELYFVIEAKGYDKYDDISIKEKLQIKSAEAFFKKLQEKGVNVKYKTKLNSPDLSVLISDILK